jgi:CheY-like chemotaxis protein
MADQQLLIIDDDQDILDSLQVILESKGYTVDTASNKEAGLKLFTSKKPDLLILDIMMEQDLEGYGMLNEFRKDESLKHIPIIMYSGMAKQLGVNFRSAVEDEKRFPNVSFVDKQEGTQELILRIQELLSE